MMTREDRKNELGLHSTRGSSLIIALAAVLVCTMVIAVILPGSVTALKGVSSDREYRQANLSLQSAAEVLASELRNVEYSYTKRTTDTLVEDYDDEGVVTGSHIVSSTYESPTTVSPADNNLAEDVVNAVTSAAGSVSVQDVGSYTVTVNDTSDATQALGTVTFTLKVVDVAKLSGATTDNYSVRANILAELTETSGQKAYVRGDGIYTARKTVTSSDAGRVTTTTITKQWKLNSVSVSNKESS